MFDFKTPQAEEMPVHEIENIISRFESEMQDFVNIEGADTDLTGFYSLSCREVPRQPLRQKPQSSIFLLRTYL